MSDCLLLEAMYWLSSSISICNQKLKLLNLLVFKNIIFFSKKSKLQIVSKVSIKECRKDKWD